MRFLIVANGPFVSRTIIRELATRDNTIVIALDGAADKLAKIGIMPNVIIGDFDSIDKNIWGLEETRFDYGDKSKDDALPPYAGKYNTTIVLATNQYATDLEKGIKYADDNGAESIDIVCATGGRMDHSIGNVRTLRKVFNSNRAVKIYTENQVLEYVKDQTVTMTGEISHPCGIMAFPEGKMTTRGLKYDTDADGIDDSFDLKYGISESTSNELQRSEATIKISGEALIIHPPQLESQKRIYSMSYVDQLKEIVSQQEYIVIETSLKEFLKYKERVNIIKKAANQDDGRKFDKNKTYYLTTSKEEIYSSQDENRYALFAMSSKKHKRFLELSKLDDSDFQEESIKELTKKFGN